MNSISKINEMSEIFSSDDPTFIGYYIFFYYPLLKQQDEETLFNEFCFIANQLVSLESSQEMEKSIDNNSFQKILSAFFLLLTKKNQKKAFLYFSSIAPNSQYLPLLKNLDGSEELKFEEFKLPYSYIDPMESERIKELAINGFAEIKNAIILNNPSIPCNLKYQLSMYPEDFQLSFALFANKIENKEKARLLFFNNAKLICDLVSAFGEKIFSLLDVVWNVRQTIDPQEFLSILNIIGSQKFSNNSFFQDNATTLNLTDFDENNTESINMKINCLLLYKTNNQSFFSLESDRQLFLQLSDNYWKELRSYYFENKTHTENNETPNFSDQEHFELIPLYEKYFENLNNPDFYDNLYFYFLINKSKHDIKPYLAIETCPALIYFILNSCDITQEKFKKFLASFEKLSNQHPLNQQVVTEKNLDKYQETLIYFIKIMGSDAIDLIQVELAGNSLTKLTTILDAMHILFDSRMPSLSDYLKKHYLRSREDIINGTIRNIFILLASILCHAYDDFDDEYGTVEVCDTTENLLMSSPPLQPSELFNKLSGFLIKKLFKNNAYSLKDDFIIKLLARLTSSELTKLLIASDKMEKENEKELFFAFIANDLLGDENGVEKFLHDENQHNEIGKSLAKHNSKIRKILKKNHINVEKALNYDEKLDFIYYNSNSSPVLEYCNAIEYMLSFLENLKKTAEVDKNKKCDLPEKVVNQLLNLITDIDILMSKLESQRNNNASKNLISDIIKKGDISGRIIRIKKGVNFLIRQSFVSHEFVEFSQHFLDAHEKVIQKEKTITNNTSQHQYSSNRKDKAHIQHFSIVQWKKTDMKTFLLGDNVGCCLALDGEQFQAMVQRRADDAMLFHVAIDKNTNRPVALIWLYLAEAIDDDTNQKKVVLVANFFEVNAGYAASDNLRKTLLNALLYFTAQYCQVSNISGLYMNPLTYGWNKHDLDSFSTVPMKIEDKVGGAFIEGGLYGDMESTKECYYLASLNSVRFHLFDHTILEHSPAQPVFVTSLFETVIRSNLNKSIDKIAAIIAHEYQVQLKSFYDTLSGNDKNFIQDVASCYQQVHNISLSAMHIPVEEKTSVYPHHISHLNSPLFKHIDSDGKIKNSLNNNDTDEHQAIFRIVR